MILRRITIKNRLRAGMGSLVAMIIVICLIGFLGANGIDVRAAETLRALGGAAHSQDQGISRNVQEIIDANTGMRLCFLLFAVASVVMGVTAFLLIQKSIESPINRITYLTSRLAERDLSIDLGASSKDEFQRVKEALRRLLQEWRTLVREMRSDAAAISAEANGLRAGAGRMLDGSDEQAARSSQVATASEEMAEAILDIAENASGIAQSASGTVVVANDGDRIVIKSLEKVTEIAHIVDDSANFVRSLGEKSKQIGGIVNVIDDIADQTNLLALNAAIEAARAGEQGKGFAVVADEVRKLAERTATSTSEIGQMIRAIQDEVSKAVCSMENATSNVDLGVDLVTRAGSALQAIVQSANELQLMVQQIASATDEMSATSSEISKDMERIASVSKGACETANGISQTSIRLAQLSEKMEKTANAFTL